MGVARRRRPGAVWIGHGASVGPLERAAGDFRRVRDELASVIGAAHRQDQQFKWMLWTGGAAFVIALLISPVLARLLPFGLDSYVAAFIMNADRWRAGEALMRAENPEAWTEVAAAVDLLKPNKAGVEACRNIAAKTKKEQRCALIVSPP